MLSAKSGILPCRAACAVMGFVGTWVGQALIGGIGLLRTGVCALLLQAGSLALAALIYRSVFTSCQMPTSTVSSAGASAALHCSARQGIFDSEQHYHLFCSFAELCYCLRKTNNLQYMTCMHGSVGHIWLKPTYIRRGPQLPQP